jgi:Abnormal spindle-like microcephaly-assoc'd, ASPM-SPD-2-Hydin
MKGARQHRTCDHIAAAIRVLAPGVALVALLVNAGCAGLTSTPTPGAPRGTSNGQSGASQTSQLSPSATQVNFGSVKVGSSTSQLVTLTAAGNANVTISKVSVSGSGFSASGGTNVILAPNESVTVSVNFQPAALGNASGTLLIASDASNSTLQVGLSGNGVSTSGNHQVDLSWQPSSSSVVGYLVFRGLTANSLSQLSPSVDTSTSYTDLSVSAGQTYVYAVKSVAAGNMTSAFSNSVTVTVPSE